ANKDPILASVRANTLQQMPQLQVDIDNDKVAAYCFPHQGAESLKKVMMFPLLARIFPVP
ncbi:hypothetical protein ADT36_21255, partial [Yersinia pestis subsp. microtus bv. Caucasica]